MTLPGLSFDWLTGQLSPLRPGFWLLLSFGLSGLTLMAMRFLSEESVWRLRVGRWVLTPYLGLLAGGLSPRLLGLSDIDWVAGLELGVGLIFAIWLLLALVRATLHRENATIDTPPPTARPLLERVVWAGAQEFHWVFLRGAIWEMILALPTPSIVPAYWAIWLASALALPGIFVQYRHISQRFIAGMLLITTAILFFYTRNFFLCWLLHASVELLLGQRGVTDTRDVDAEQVTRRDVMRET
ncbi:MAG: hypothetical protein HY328_08335 [Chloroflexi bacterium]|nr:hypothetical protein [Chloroflexota bacterium]